MSDSLQLHGLQHARLPCPSPTPGAFSYSWLLSWWCIQPSHPLLSPSFFNLSQHQGLFQWISSSNQVAKVLEFHLSISPSNEYSGLISFRIEWFDLLTVQETLKSSLTLQLENINPLAFSLLYGPTLTSMGDYWKKQSFDYIDLCEQSDVSDF